MDDANLATVISVPTGSGESSRTSVRLSNARSPISNCPPGVNWNERRMMNAQSPPSTPIARVVSRGIRMGVGLGVGAGASVLAALGVRSAPLLVVLGAGVGNSGGVHATRAASSSTSHPRIHRGSQDGPPCASELLVSKSYPPSAGLERLLSLWGRERLVELVEIAFRELDDGRAAVLAHVLGIGGFRDRDDAVLADHPRERDLHRHRVVALGHAFQHRMRMGEQPFFNGGVGDDRAVPLAHPRQEIPLDAAPFEVVEDLVRDDALEATFEPAELRHLVNIEVTDTRIADLLRLEEVLEASEGLFQGHVARA